MGRPPRKKGLSLARDDIQALATFRFELRRYLSFAASAAEDGGVTMQQHQALLAIEASKTRSLSIGELADLLFLRHHSGVELSDRLVKANLVVRTRDPDDGRRAVLRLTSRGQATLTALAAEHLRELQERGPELVKSLQSILERAPGDAVTDPE